jgi:hypothetical protein
VAAQDVAFRQARVVEVCARIVDHAFFSIARRVGLGGSYCFSEAR